MENPVSPSFPLSLRKPELPFAKTIIVLFILAVLSVLGGILGGLGLAYGALFILAVQQKKRFPRPFPASLTLHCVNLMSGQAVGFRPRSRA